MATCRPSSPVPPAVPLLRVYELLAEVALEHSPEHGSGGRGGGGRGVPRAVGAAGARRHLGQP